MRITRSGVAALIGVGFVAGAAFGPAGGVVARGIGIASASAQGAAGDDRQTGQLLALFNEVFNVVKADYVEPVSSRTLMDNALSGMLSGLDPHSAYMNAQQWDDMQTNTSGQFGGIGLEVTDMNGLLQVVSPIDDTPAANAGLKPGDLVTAVNGKSVEGLSLNAAVAEMRGPPDTILHLTVKRANVTDPLNFTLTRQIIKIHTVTTKLLGDIGVIRISEFTEQTNPGLRAALRKLRSDAGGHLRGLVLDLRNDPGGLLDQAVSVANDFVGKGPIVSTRGRHKDDDHVWYAEPGDEVAGKLPVVVLVNNGTASAAEIVAGALQDDQRALVIGTQTFGKGSVQTVIPLPGNGNGGMRLTTARYYTPTGRSIQGVGITPDVVVEQSRTPTPHFGPAHEADLLHILTNTGSEKAPPPPPQADIPEIAHSIPKLPPENFPAYDPAKPDTDFQLQQAITLVRAVADSHQAAAR